jgi:hypothetical protein
MLMRELKRKEDDKQLHNLWIGQFLWAVRQLTGETHAVLRRSVESGGKVWAAGEQCKRSVRGSVFDFMWRCN